jgi:hypothetical protein
MGLVLLVLLLTMSAAWGLWHMIDTMTAPQRPPEAAPGTRP